jgi:hypothetical protein
MDKESARDRARRVGRDIAHGDWVLAADVACCVTLDSESGKVSARRFAAEANSTTARVMAYLDAWNASAASGLVPPAASLTPASDPPLPPAARWAEFFGSPR